MLNRIKIGDTVKVWPKPGLRVQSHADIPGRWLADEGQSVVWTDWLAARARDGSLLLTDPKPAVVRPRTLAPGEILESGESPPGVAGERISASEIGDGVGDFALPRSKGIGAFETVVAEDHHSPAAKAEKAE